MTLKDLYTEHNGKVSDKWNLYLEEYEKILGPIRHKALRILEIGVQNGGSLEIWAKYFPNATILVGCDINPKCNNLAFEDPRIAVIVGDATQDETLQKISSLSAQFDIIIDDGSHQSKQIIDGFARYFSILETDGLYIIEDLHCSYWQSFQGGLYHPFSSISFLKNLADIINKEHWGVGVRVEKFLSHFQTHSTHLDEISHQLHSVKFINSICIIEKKSIEHNKLGPRIIAGSVEDIVQGHLDIKNLPISKLNENDNPWSRSSLVDIIEETKKIQLAATEEICRLEKLHKVLTNKLEDDNNTIHRANILIENLELQNNKSLQLLTETKIQLAEINSQNYITTIDLEKSIQREKELSAKITALRSTLSWKLTKFPRMLVNLISSGKLHDN